MQLRVIQPGDSVMLQFDDTTYVLVSQLSATSTVKLRKKCTVSGALLLGAPYGAIFEFKDKALVRLARRPDAADIMAHSKGHGEDNRSLALNADAQKLSQDDVEAMKQRGAGAQDIITALMQNSETMATKTQFSQEKWVKRKMAKYSVVFQVVAPSGMAVAKAFWHKDCEKIRYLRWDSLAWMLNCANLRSGTRPLVVDGCGGLLAGAVAERLYGEAESIMCAYVGAGPPLHLLSFFNLPPAVRGTLETLRLIALVQQAERHAQRYHSLLMAVEGQMHELLVSVWPLLVLGANVVVFSEYVEAFRPVVAWLRSAHVAVEYHISEIFHRDYQVLPGRSHPMMQMRSASGFVLTMIKVDPSHSAAPEQAAAHERYSARGANNKGGAKRDREEVHQPLPPAAKQSKAKEEEEEEEEQEQEEGSVSQ